MGRAKDITNQKFGRWTVISPNTERKSGAVYWNCVCDCGNTGVIAGFSLRLGTSESCGCYHKERVSETKTTHGRTASPIYQVWSNMRRRCNDPNNPAYANYGGRGITVCERWNSSFENFLYDVGEPPNPKDTIDRIDNSKGYEPGNVKWSTRQEQNQNKRNVIFYTMNGKTKTIAEWAEQYGIKHPTLHRRLTVNKMSLEDAVKLPNQRGKKFK